jgi:Thiamine monophosphate synthase
MSLPFRRIAILDPGVCFDAPLTSLSPAAIHSQTTKWMHKAFAAKADAFYLRLRDAKPTAAMHIIESATAFDSNMPRARFILSHNFASLAPIGFCIQWAEGTSHTTSPAHAGLRGLSCHSQQSAIEAATNGFDYAFLSPVFSTKTHPTHSPLGIQTLAETCKTSQMPIFALGGITLENEKECFASGAAGIAAIRMFLS